jgi:hypothetical protein
MDIYINYCALMRNLLNLPLRFIFEVSRRFVSEFCVRLPPATGGNDYGIWLFRARPSPMAKQLTEFGRPGHGDLPCQVSPQ